MRILALDAALARCSAAVWVDGVVLAERAEPGGRGQPMAGGARLAPLAQAVLRAANIAPTALDGVGVTVGPGSFTGLRAALALAHGIARAAGRPALGVTVAEALAESLPEALPGLAGRALWVAIDSRRGRIFLARDGAVAAVALDALPMPDGPVAIAGDAAEEVAARLAARGADVMLTDARLPSAGAVAAVAARRLAGALPPLAARPLYVDPPEARLPAGGLRPPPV